MAINECNICHGIGSVTTAQQDHEGNYLEDHCPNGCPDGFDAQYAATSPPSSLEGVEVVAIVTLGGLFHGGSGPEFSDIDMEPNMPALERIQCELVDSSDDEKVELMTVANHQRIDAARLAEIEALKAELAGLRGFAGEIYQVLGALGAPADVLDNASDAASGDPLRHSTLLPFVPSPLSKCRRAGSWCRLSRRRR